MAGRYATALFDLALEAGAVERVEAELGQIEAMLQESAELRRLVRSPVFSAEDQARALAAVLEKAQITGLTANFIGLITRNRRLFALTDMIAAFRSLAAQHRGEITAEVTSATALSDAQTSALNTVLSAALGQNVKMRIDVDPALLGGLVVKVGSRMVDSSLRTKLNSLKVAMREVR